MGASRQWLGVEKPAFDSLEADESCDVVGLENSYLRLIDMKEQSHSR